MNVRKATPKYGANSTFYVMYFLPYFPPKKIQKKEKEGKPVNLGHISDADPGLLLSCPHPDRLPPGEAKAGEGL